MTDQDELINLDHEITQLRAELGRLHHHLALTLKDLNVDTKVGDLLIASADEFGIEAAIARLHENPSAFGLSASSRLLERTHLALVSDLVDQTYTTDQDLSRLVNAREATLADEKPGRLRVYNVAGREAVFDVETRTARFVDDGSTVDLSVDVVEPTGFPERMPEREPLSRDKDRDR